MWLLRKQGTGNNTNADWSGTHPSNTSSFFSCSLSILSSTVFSITNLVLLNTWGEKTLIYKHYPLDPSPCREALPGIGRCQVWSSLYFYTPITRVSFYSSHLIMTFNEKSRLNTSIRKFSVLRVLQQCDHFKVT
jgi:hypothetical protein